MNDEQRYKEALLHVIKFLSGDGWDSFKPVSAAYANQVVAMCRLVVNEGKTTEEAINEITQ